MASHVCFIPLCSKNFRVVRRFVPTSGGELTVYACSTLLRPPAAALRAAGQAALNRHLDQKIGSETDVLIERETSGRLADFTPVQFDQISAEAGRPIRARIIGHDTTRLKAVAL